MAEKRKALSKSTRFEVFKRDKFTCQYCGRMAPDVILEVDHIKPVAEGGKNTMLNLITSCRDCNRGKGKKKLSDDSTLKKQQTELADLAEKREQMELMLMWRESLLEFEREKVDIAVDAFTTYTDFQPNEIGKARLSKLVREFDLPIVLDALEIAHSQYFEGDQWSAEKMLDKLGGICYNKAHKKNAWD